MRIRMQDLQIDADEDQAHPADEGPGGLDVDGGPPPDEGPGDLDVDGGPPADQGPGDFDIDGGPPQIATSMPTATAYSASEGLDRFRKLASEGSGFCVPACDAGCRDCPDDFVCIDSRVEYLRP